MYTSRKTLTASITDVLAGEHIASGEALDEWSVDGQSPELYVNPQTADDLAMVLKVSNEAEAAVIPRGAGTKMALGNVPKEYRVSLSTRSLNGVLEYTPADMTVSVQAGMKLLDLQAVLATEKQFLPLDPPHGQTATIGGILAANSSGPLRAGYGTLRDHLIGIRVAHVDGIITKAGGKVVKNVTGYDLNKLYTGSLGTLGVIVEANFKLQPLPAVQKSVLAVSSGTVLGEVVDSLVASVLMPNAVELLDSNALRKVSSNRNTDAQYGLLVRYGGNLKAVDRQVRDTKLMCSEAGTCVVFSDKPQELIWKDVCDMQSSADARGSAICKISVLSSEVLSTFEQIRSLADDEGVSVMLWGRAMNGICYAAFDQAELRSGAVKSVVENLRTRLAGGSSSVVLESCPKSIKAGIDVWGVAVDPASFDIMKSIKKQFDPRNIMNPGRFVGGI